MKKNCSGCNVEKELNADNFPKNKTKKYGYECKCKQCKKKIDSDRYSEKSQEILFQKKEYYQQNKEKIISRQRAYYRKNKDGCS